MIVDKKMEQLQQGVSRRNFLAGAGALGAASVLAGCSGSGSPGITTTNTGFTDFDILNFALNLEYLEAEFYLYAATGAGLSAADAGAGAGTTIVPAATKVTGLSTAQQNILNEIAFDEQSHVKFLRAAITAFGGTPVSRPNLDLTFFGPLAMVAGITTVATGTGSFSPFASGFDNFAVGAFIFEDVGVTAYNGAATLISNAGVSNGVLAAAAGILAVEAYHAAYIRTYLTAQAIAGLNATTTSTTASTSYAPFGYANKVAALRSSLGGGNETPLVLPNTILGAPPTPAFATPVYASSLVAAGSTALAYSRTVDQVHHIVYGNATPGVAKGGFFPNGTNSIFAQTTS